MAKILQKKRLNSEMHLLKVTAPLVAKRTQPGQFIILRIGERGERIPLTVYEAEAAKGIIGLIFQEVGKTTRHLGRMRKGERILDLIGPLGKPSPIAHYGRVLCIGGGVGVAELYPVARALYEKDNRLTSILGFRTKELVIQEGQMNRMGQVFVTTDDGSYGRKGLVTDVLKELLDRQPFDIAFCVGPVIMMKKVCEITKTNRLNTIVSLNSIMVDGTGMCGSCRVKVSGEMRFTCVDGPDFNGHQIDFDELLYRQNRFLRQEKTSLEAFRKEESLKCPKEQ